MEYQVVHSEIPVDKGELIINGWQISHQPIGEFVHGWDVLVSCCCILLCPGGHL